MGAFWKSYWAEVLCNKLFKKLENITIEVICSFLNILNEEQQAQRMQIALSLLIRQKQEDFLDSLITCDEKWVLYDKRWRSIKWLEMGLIEIYAKTNPISEGDDNSFVDSSKMVHYKFLEPDETMIAESYCEHF